MKILTNEELLEIQKAPKITTSRFEINLGKVDKAREILGVDFPVKIKITSGSKSRVGSHRKNPGENFHRITVSKMQSLIEMNKTLWHELQHAADCERWIRDYRETLISYRTIVNEKAAIAVENEYGHTHLLVREI